MALIEGVGDEVVQFVGALVLVAVGMLAWRSTNARPDRYRTVLLMRSQRHPHHPVTVSIRTRPNNTVENPQENTVAQSQQISNSADRTESGSGEARRESRVIPLQEMDSIVDADMAMIDNNRLHFYRRVDGPNASPRMVPMISVGAEEGGAGGGAGEGAGASEAQIREMDSIVSAMEADVTASRPEPNTASDDREKSDSNTEAASSSNVNDEDEQTSVSGEGDQANAEAKKILIKLKYLNDTLREVEGRLDELLKDFKWRHFSSELSRSRRVVLIYKGRVLSEHATLRALGLRHRAVVHALVHPPRSAAAAAQSSGQLVTAEEAPLEATHELVTEAAGERQWDLENILMTLVSVALTIVWFFRCEYSNMFTASASVALFGLTVFYSVAIFGLYLTDTFHFDRRAPPPAPASAPAPNPAPPVQQESL